MQIRRAAFYVETPPATAIFTSVSAHSGCAGKPKYRDQPFGERFWRQRASPASIDQRAALRQEFRDLGSCLEMANHQTGLLVAIRTCVTDPPLSTLLRLAEVGGAEGPPGGPAGAQHHDGGIPVGAGSHR